MTEIGKILVGVGLVIVLVGVLVIFAGKANLPIGRLPGDILYRGKHTTFYFPLMTSILLSVILSVVLYLITRIKH